MSDFNMISTSPVNYIKTFLILIVKTVDLYIVDKNIPHLQQ